MIQLKIRKPSAGLHSATRKEHVHELALFYL